MCKRKRFPSCDSVRGRNEPFLDIQAALGWLNLAKGEEVQRESDWAFLGQTVKDRVTAYQAGLQKDIEAHTGKEDKGRLDETTSALEPHSRKQRELKTKPRAKKVFGIKSFPKTFEQQTVLENHERTHT